ncbi:unknown [Proteobacteria bacterium CAG:495]|nr:unknown [Proteobacteria bacterium CAG:495]
MIFSAIRKNVKNTTTTRLTQMESRPASAPVWAAATAVTAAILFRADTAAETVPALIFLQFLEKIFFPSFPAAAADFPDLAEHRRVGRAKARISPIRCAWISCRRLAATKKRLTSTVKTLMSKYLPERRMARLCG